MCMDGGGNKTHHRQQYMESIEEIITNIPDNYIKVNVLTTIAILKDHKVLQSEKCETLTRLCSGERSNKERLKSFACNIYKTEPLEYVFQILDLIGQNDISNAISQPRYRHVIRVELPYSKHLQSFYYRLKHNIDWKTFHNTGKGLENLHSIIIRSFNKCKNDDDIHRATGRLAVVTWLRIQHCKRDTKLIREVLNGMIENWPRGIDDTLALIFYHSKMAIAAIMDGDVPSAEKHNRIAKHISASFQDPLTKSLICHDSRYTNQRIFEYQRTEKHRKAVYDETITGLCFIESDSNCCELFNQQMKRMFLLYAAQYKLNIHNDLNCLESDRVSVDDVKDASNLVGCFEESLDQIDPRREMIYLVCKAKIHEGEEQAKTFLSRATELADEGAIYTNEATNIRHFTNRLLTRNQSLV